MTDEEYFRKHYPDSCYGDKPLSPYWDFFQDGVEFGERQSEKKIEELEKENAELKMKIYGGGYEIIITKKDADIILLEKQLKEQKEHHKSVCEILTNTHRSLREQLTKAEEIILKLYNAGRDILMCRAEEKVYDNLSNAINDKSIELFLEEIEK